MTELEALREYASFSGTPIDMRAVLLSSADRIEKLEAALREIATRCDAHRLPRCDRNTQWAADTARKALEGKNG